MVIWDTLHLITSATKIVIPREECLWTGATIPSCLQHHDCVFSLIGAGWGECDIDVRNATAARVAMPTTCHPTFLNTSIGRPGSECLQPCCQSMQLMDKSKASLDFLFSILSLHTYMLSTATPRKKSHPSGVPQGLFL